MNKGKKGESGRQTKSAQFAGYVPKPVQLELRRAIRLIHKEDDYFGGMDILADLAGLPNNRIETVPSSFAEIIKAHNATDELPKSTGD